MNSFQGETRTHQFKHIVNKCKINGFKKYKYTESKHFINLANKQNVFTMPDILWVYIFKKLKYKYRKCTPIAILNIFSSV